MPELRGPVHPAALRLGDLPQQGNDPGDGGARGGPQAGCAGFAEPVWGKPRAQRRPAPAPVLEQFVVTHERTLVGLGRVPEQGFRS